jgi:hypothetical protein
MLLILRETGPFLRFGAFMDARDYLFRLAGLRYRTRSGSRPENVRIIEVSSLVDQIALSLDLLSADRYALMMARAAALAGHPDLAITKVEAVLRRIAER